MHLVQKVIPKWLWNNTTPIIYTAGLVYLSLKAVSLTRRKYRKWKVLNRWKCTEKDLVIVHSLARGKCIPSPSPFVLKLETYLRMAAIPYEVDPVDTFGPTKKTPWITLNGDHVGDTEIIIDFLSKKFDKRLGRNYSEEERSLATLVRITCDEYLYWAGLLGRYVHDKANDAEFIYSEPSSTFGMRYLQKRLYKMGVDCTFGQGLGRLPRSDVERLGLKALSAVAVFLGNKKFILGDDPVEEDASVFGLVAHLVYCHFPTTTTPYCKFVKDNHPNLIAYCDRMKTVFWPDWNRCLAN